MSPSAAEVAAASPCPFSELPGVALPIFLFAPEPPFYTQQGKVPYMPMLNRYVLGCTRLCLTCPDQDRLPPPWPWRLCDPRYPTRNDTRSGSRVPCQALRRPLRRPCPAPLALLIRRLGLNGAIFPPCQSARCSEWASASSAQSPPFSSWASCSSVSVLLCRPSRRVSAVSTLFRPPGLLLLLPFFSRFWDLACGTACPQSSPSTTKKVCYERPCLVSR